MYLYTYISFFLKKLVLTLILLLSVMICFYLWFIEGSLPFLGGGGDDLKRLPLVLILHKLLRGFMVIVYNIHLYIYI